MMGDGGVEPEELTFRRPVGVWERGNGTKVVGSGEQAYREVLKRMAFAKLELKKEPSNDNSRKLGSWQRQRQMLSYLMLVNGQGGEAGAKEVVQQASELLAGLGRMREEWKKEDVDGKVLIRYRSENAETDLEVEEQWRVDQAEETAVELERLLGLYVAIDVGEKWGKG